MTLDDNLALALTDALNKLSAALSDFSTPKSSDILLSVWIKDWFYTYKCNVLKPTTSTEYLRIIENYINPAIGAIKLSALSTANIQNLINSIPHDNTRKKVFNVLHACLEKACLPSIGYLHLNPCNGVELPKNKPVNHRRAYSFEEQRLLLAALPDRYSRAFFFLCCTGLRLGEFLALTPEDVDFDLHAIRINKACDKKMNLTTPKTSSSVRSVFFDDSLFEFFPLSALGSYTHNGMHCQFVRTLKSLKLKELCIHSTRHTFATLCDYVGIRDKITQSMLGHSTIAMTKDIYTHLYKTGNSPVLKYFEALKYTLENTVHLR